MNLLLSGVRKAIKIEALRDRAVLSDLASAKRQQKNPKYVIKRIAARDGAANCV